MRMQQPLCHLYFYTVMENDLLHNSDLGTLTGLAIKIQGELEKATGGDAVLKQIEFQAVVQVLIQQLALHLNPSQSHMLSDVQNVNDKINRLAILHATLLEIFSTSGD